MKDIKDIFIEKDNKTYLDIEALDKATYHPKKLGVKASGSKESKFLEVKNSGYLENSIALTILVGVISVAVLYPLFILLALIFFGVMKSTLILSNLPVKTTKYKG